MEIFKGIKFYDLGYFVYDLWTLIIIILLSSIVIYFSSNGLIKLFPKTKEKEFNIIDLLLPVTMLIGQVSTTSDQTRLIFLIVTLIISFILRRKLPPYISIIICSLIGFGYNLLPIGIALFIYLIGYIVNKKRNVI